MKSLLLFPHHAVPARDAALAAGEVPENEVESLAMGLRQTPSGRVTILHYGDIPKAGMFVRLVKALLGPCWALAVLAASRCGQYDAVFSHAENIGIPFALLLKLRLRRPRHVMVGIYLTGRRNQLPFGLVGVDRQFDAIFTNSPIVYEIARDKLGIPPEKLHLTTRYGVVDTRFYVPQPGISADDNRIGALGLDYRDYEILVAAVADMPDVRVTIDPTSPWSSHETKIGTVALPSNVEIRMHEFGKIREFYARCAIVAIPLVPNHISAGMTTMLEAMSMGKAVIVTDTEGHRKLGHGEAVQLVPPHDVEAWRHAIRKLIDDPEYRECLGRNARAWAMRNVSRDAWVEGIIAAMHPGRVGSSRDHSTAVRGFAGQDRGADQSFP